MTKREFIETVTKPQSKNGISKKAIEATVLTFFYHESIHQKKMVIFPTPI